MWYLKLLFPELPETVDCSTQAENYLHSIVWFAATVNTVVQLILIIYQIIYLLYHVLIVSNKENNCQNGKSSSYCTSLGKTPEQDIISFSWRTISWSVFIYCEYHSQKISTSLNIPRGGLI